MIKKELLSILYNKRKLMLSFVFVFIICFDAFLVFRGSFLYENLIHPDFNYDLKTVYENTRQPFAASFLSSTSLGHIPQKIIIWLLPIYFLIICSDSYIQEKKLNYHHVLMIRTSQIKIFISQCFASFIFGFFISLIALLLNFFICYFIFYNGLREPISCNHIINILSLQYPYITYFIYIFIFSFTTGITSAASQALAYIVPYHIPLYLISFGVWFYQIGAKNSIAYVLQPYIEYGLDYMIPSYALFLGIYLSIIIIGYFKVKYYEDI